MTPTKDMMLAATDVRQETDRLTGEFAFALRAAALRLVSEPRENHERIVARCADVLTALGLPTEADKDTLRFDVGVARWCRRNTMWGIAVGLDWHYGARAVAGILVTLAHVQAKASAPTPAPPEPVWRNEDGTALSDDELRRRLMGGALYSPRHRPELVA